MKFLILAIGKPKLDYAAEGVHEYAKRLQRYASVKIEYLKTRDESETLLLNSAGTYRIALDERGLTLRTSQLTERVSELEHRGEIKTVAFLIGGANGHTEKLRNECEEIWSLSSLTLQHELALVILMEQIYRVFTIKRGEPYHRE